MEVGKLYYGDRRDHKKVTVVELGMYSVSDGAVPALAGELHKNVVVVNTHRLGQSIWSVHRTRDGRVVAIRPHLIEGYGLPEPEPSRKRYPHLEIWPVDGADYVEISLIEPSLRPILVDKLSLPVLLARGFVSRFGQVVTLVNRSAEALAMATEGTIRRIVEVPPWSVWVFRPCKDERVRFFGRIPAAVRGGRWRASDIVRAEQMLGLRPRSDRAEPR
jgi:hypothetical protein